jgi:DNA-binding XRE family transcriptional regulator
MEVEFGRPPPPIKSVKIEMSLEKLDIIDAGELRMVRTLLGLTQKEMAEELDISTRTIEEYESGRKPIPKIMRAALHYVSLVAAVQRGNPRLVTDNTARLADKLATMRGGSIIAAAIQGQGELATKNFPDIWKRLEDRYGLTPIR